MASYPTTSLQPGATGSSVKQLQDYLVSQGYMTQAEVNTGYGTYGPKTTAAVKRLQEARGVDNSTGPGYWGPRTISALSGSASQTQPIPVTPKPIQQAPANNQAEIQRVQAELAAKQAELARQQEIERIQAEVAKKQEILNQAQQQGYTNEDIQIDPATNKVLPPNQTLPPEYDTGNNGLNDILKELKGLLDKTISAGKVVNPAVELTPAQIQGFLDQASKEISPYYASQITAIKDDLGKNIQNLQKQYELEKEGAESEFKESLSGQRETSAGRGLTFSGVRGQQEQSLASAQQRQLDLSALQTESAVGSKLRNLEGQVGSSNLPTLPTFSSLTASTEGQGRFRPGRTLSFAPTGNIYGTLPGQQLTEIQKRKNELETSARQGRVLDFYNI